MGTTTTPGPTPSVSSSAAPAVSINADVPVNAPTASLGMSTFSYIVQTNKAVSAPLVTASASDVPANDDRDNGEQEGPTCVPPFPIGPMPCGPCKPCDTGNLECLEAYNHKSCMPGVWVTSCVSCSINRRACMKYEEEDIVLARKAHDFPLPSSEDDQCFALHLATSGKKRARYRPQGNHSTSAGGSPGMSIVFQKHFLMYCH